MLTVLFFSPDMEMYRRPGNVKIPFWLQPDKYYAGMAWYQKKIHIPRILEREKHTAFLERCHWESRVWLMIHEAGCRIP